MYTFTPTYYITVLCGLVPGLGLTNRIGEAYGSILKKIGKNVIKFSLYLDKYLKLTF